MKRDGWKYRVSGGCLAVALLIAIGTFVVVGMKSPFVRTDPMPTRIQIGKQKFNFPEEVVEQIIPAGANTSTSSIARIKFPLSRIIPIQSPQVTSQKVIVTISENDHILSGDETLQNIRESGQKLEESHISPSLNEIRGLNNVRRYVARIDGSKSVFITCTPWCSYNFEIEAGVIANVWTPSDEILKNWPEFHLELMDNISTYAKD